MATTLMHDARAKRSGQIVTVPLALPLELYAEILAMGVYDGDADLSDTITDSMGGEVDAWLDSGSLTKRQGDENPADFLRNFTETHPPEKLLAEHQRAGLLVKFTHQAILPELSQVTDCVTVGDTRYQAMLDAHVTSLLDQYKAKYPNEDTRDTINGLLACLLECELSHASKGGGVSVVEARERRRRREADTRNCREEGTTGAAETAPAAKAPLVRRRESMPCPAPTGTNRDALTMLRWMLACEQADVEDLDGRPEHRQEWLEAVRMRDLHRESIRALTLREGDGEPPVTIKLDDLASASLRRTCREGSECFAPGADPRDLASAAVTYFLCDESDVVDGFPLNDSRQALARAEGARRRKEAA